MQAAALAKADEGCDLVGRPEAVLKHNPCAAQILDIRPHHRGWHASTPDAFMDLGVSNRIVF